jgi:hypothetical protein
MFLVARVSLKRGTGKQSSICNVCHRRGFNDQLAPAGFCWMFSAGGTGTKAVEDYWNSHNPKPLKQTVWDFFYP